MPVYGGVPVRLGRLRPAVRAARRTKRRSLRTPGHFVVWVRKETMPWAEWGAGRGHFELEWTDGLTYLRALRAE